LVDLICIFWITESDRNDRMRFLCEAEAERDRLSVKKVCIILIIFGVFN
jgi:hypothetical protein